MDDIDLRPGREWPIPPMDKASGHKPSAFTWEMGHLILQRIADGETVKAITADPRMPAYCTVFRWMQVVPAFRTAVLDVREVLAQDRLRRREAARAAKGPKRTSGRKSTYDQAVARRLLRAVARGASLSELVARPGAPSFKAIYRWLADRPDFRARYIEACSLREGWLEFQAEFVVIDDVWTEGIVATERKIRALRARAGRLRPKLYRAWKLGDPDADL